MIGEKLFFCDKNCLVLIGVGSCLLLYGEKIVVFNDQVMVEFGKLQVMGNIWLGIFSEFSIMFMFKII